MTEEELFQNYIAICNKALNKNKDIFPFNKILAATNMHDMTVPSMVRVVDDANANTYEVSIKNSEIHLTNAGCVDACNQCSLRCNDVKKTVWQIRTSYLNEVVSNPQNYIENPAMLDWEWATINKR